ncbi:hypothetical protein [Dongia rigui]|uniref:Uncharacterized protein n=1 Tax=Dongia rigui TaxID=940149 RepID=A0ABU5E331_9PROT|nr:hypothetical protein [Dongia rigui]MDY0873971.1 hypothetical protein [Dongia rigui]
MTISVVKECRGNGGMSRPALQIAVLVGAGEMCHISAFDFHATTRPSLAVMAKPTSPSSSKAEFRDDGRALLSFAERVRVRCRKCQAPGIVLMQRDGAQAGANFRCGSCGTAGSIADKDWFGPLVVGGKRHCQFCGHSWSVAARRLAPGARSPRHVKARCPQCDKETRNVAVLSPGVVPGEPTDPYLGLALLLVAETRFGPLWCYNEEHLSFLKDYVTASQRRRTNATTHHSMFVRLPAWMKLAKNRDEVLKGLARIEAMAATSHALG